MNTHKPPTTNVLSYHDPLSDEWVTTITIRHSTKSDTKNYIDNLASLASMTNWKNANNNPVLSTQSIQNLSLSKPLKLSTSDIKPLTVEEIKNLSKLFANNAPKSCYDDIEGLTLL